MGKLIISGAGGAGVGSDECTALKNDVLKGMRAITADSDDEVVEGTLELTGDAADSQVLEGKTYYNTNPKSKRTGAMTNHGAVNQSLNAGGNYTIPSGYHNGGGKVTANSLASQTSATATVAQIINGQTAWVNGSKITGSMPSYGGTYWNNNLGIGLEADNLYSFFPVGYYAAFDSRGSLHRMPIARLRSAIGATADKIKKGQTIAGIIGTFEGYVPNAQDLYLRGSNIANITPLSTNGDGYIRLDSGQISIASIYYEQHMSFTRNFAGFSRLNFEVNISDSNVPVSAIQLFRSVRGELLGSIGGIAGDSTTRTYSMDITRIQLNITFYVRIHEIKGAIYRIWLS